MRLSAFDNAIVFIVAAALLASCSSDPARQKQKYLNSGERYFTVGRYREAVVEFKAALQIDPKYAAAHYQLGRAFLASKNFDSAYRELNEAVTLDPSNWPAQLELAKLLVARRQLDRAQAIAQTVLRTDPANARAHAILGESHTLTRDFQKAIQEFQKVVELDPRQTDNYGALGAAYRAAGLISEAEHAYKQAIKINPKSTPAHMALSQFYFSVGKMADAEVEMRAASDLDSRAIPPRLFLARIYLAMGRSADAEKVYLALKSVAPADPQAYEALGLFYRSEGLKQKAAAEFQILVKDHPNDYLAKARLAETLLDLNRVTEAQPLVHDILRANPEDPRALLSQGRILLLQHDYRRAVDTLQKAVKAAPDSASAYYSLGIAQQFAGLAEAAKSSFSTALQLEPRMASATAALAGLALRSGDYTEAARQAERARKADPNLASAKLTSARAMIGKGDLRQAEAHLQEVLKRDPSSLRGLSMLLNVYIREERGNEGVQRIAGLVQQHPQNAGLHFLLGLAYFNLKNLPQAEACTLRALSLDPKTPDAYTLLANINLSRGAVTEAKANLRAAIAAQPHSLLNYMTLVTEFEKEGNWNEAKKFCQKAHEIDPEAPLVSAELAFLYLEHGGDVNVAVSLAQSAKRRMPDSPVTADALGWAFYKLGSQASAITQLKESTAKAPNNPIYQYHLGMAYLASRRSDLAAQALRVALKTDPNFRYADSARDALTKLPKGGA